MNSLEKFISQEFESLKLYSIESENILIIELCDYLSTSHNKYINACYEKAIKIFEFINSPKDEILIVANIYKEKEEYIYKKEKLNIKRFFRNKKVLKSLNCTSTDAKHVKSDILGKNEYINHYYLTCNTKDLNYKKLILHLCKADFFHEVRPMHDYFIINKSKKIAYRMMDDREIEIIFNGSEFNKENWLNFLE